MQPIPIIIDCDPGIDDVVALALATHSPELDIRAVTTTYGNAPLDLTTRNAIELLERAGRQDIPVLPGAACPLNRSLATAPETHGDTGVGYAPVQPAVGVQGDPNVLVTTLRRESAPVVLVTLGPLTNLAHALRADRAFVIAHVRRYLGMFGNVTERGNTNRWADFNAWCDPEGTAEVIASGLPVEMVGLDVTRRMVMSAAQVEHLGKSPHPIARWLSEALRFYVEFHRSQERLDGCVVNDVLPIGELLRPGMLTFERLRLTVDLDGEAHRGHTRETREGHPTDVATRVDVESMKELLQRVLGTGWAEV